MADGIERRDCPRDDCDWWVIGTRGPVADQALAEHEAQHGPGRALDITVEWEVSALCSVCEDGVGDVQQEGDELICQDCGTCWFIDGTGGYRCEENQWIPMT